MFKNLTIVVSILAVSLLAKAQPSQSQQASSEELKHHMAAVLAEPGGVTLLINVLKKLRDPNQIALAELAGCQTFNEGDQSKLRECIVQKVIDSK